MERGLQLSGEEPLATDQRQGCVENAIAFGLDDYRLGAEREHQQDMLGLPAGELRAACAKVQIGPHGYFVSAKGQRAASRPKTSRTVSA